MAVIAFSSLHHQLTFILEPLFHLCVSYVRCGGYVLLSTMKHLHHNKLSRAAYGKHSLCAFPQQMLYLTRADPSLFQLRVCPPQPFQTPILYSSSRGYTQEW
jgi:hypothetical protein